MPPRKLKNLEPTCSRKSSRATTPDGRDELFNCRSCDRPDSADDMVQCDMCEAWNHLSCAGVNHSIEDKSYVCTNCPGKSRNFSNLPLTSSTAVVRLTNEEAAQKQTPNASEPKIIPETSEYGSVCPSFANVAIAANSTCFTTCSAPSAAKVAAKRGTLESLSYSSKAYMTTKPTTTCTNTLSSISVTDVLTNCWASTNDHSLPPHSMSAGLCYASTNRTLLVNEHNLLPPKSTSLLNVNINNAISYSAPSAVEDAAKRGPLPLAPGSLQPCESVESLNSCTPRFNECSAPSAAEVAAKCGTQSFLPISSQYCVSARSNDGPGPSKYAAPSISETISYAGTLVSASKLLQPYTFASSINSFATRHNIQSTPRSVDVTYIGLQAPVPPLPADPVMSVSSNVYTATDTTTKGRVPAYSATEAAAMRGHYIPVTHSTRVPSRTSSSSRSLKSNTDKLKMELQRIEEEKQAQEYLDKEIIRLRKEREAEYLNKKYKIINQIIDSSDEEDEERDFEPRMLPKQNINAWMAGFPNKNYLHSTTNVLTHPQEFMPTYCQSSHLIKVTEAYTSQIPTSNAVSSNQVDLSHQYRGGGAALYADKQQSTFKPFVNEHVTNVTPPATTHMPQMSLHQVPHFQDTVHNVPPPATTHMPQMSLHQVPHFQGTVHNVPPHNVLTKNNIAARSLIRDLPYFDGQPSEWPLFIASYNRSTELGGFSNEENLIRLHKALKGDALEAVKSLIIQPNCVGRVIETLKMLYGRPELIINTLIRTINSTPAPKADKFETIVTFAIAVQNLCATFEASGIGYNVNFPTLMQGLVEKLPPTLRLNWAVHKKALTACTLSDFSAWLYAIAEAANGVLVNAPTSSNSEKNLRSKNWNKGVVNAHYNAHYKEGNQSVKQPTTKCCLCGLSCASVEDCQHFLKLNRTARWAEVRKQKLCSRCLKKHLRHKCSLDASCGINNCESKHHQLLHKYEPPAINASEAATVGVHAKCSPNTFNFKTNSVLFRIVPVLLYRENVKIKVFALLDDGSSVTLLDEEVAKQLNAKGEKRPLCLKWTGNTSRLESQSELINLQISGIGKDSERFHLANVHTVQKLALPAQTVNNEELQHKFKHLKNVCFDSYNQAVPRLLIGVNNAKLGQPIKSREGGWNEPIASKTRLGWVVHGTGVNEANNQIETHNFHVCDCNDQDLHQLVNDFICDDTLKASDSNRTLISEEDNRALGILKSHTIQKNGKYETSLLWKFDDVRLPDSYPMAKRRLRCLQKRMSQNPELAKILENKIQEYESKGYARKLTKQEIQNNQGHCWYLPIFPVQNVNKPGKIRIVWDAAASVSGNSLNSVLLKGPDQLSPLTSVIYKFREQKFGICGDIQEMFHQIKIREADQHFQRFLWGCDENGHPDTYVMVAMTFGATCSPCTAHFIKNMNADKFAEQYPRAVQSIKENHYVDDLMDSTPTEEEAINLAQQIRFVHKQGGFHIRNWVSNSSRVLEALGSEPTQQINMNVNVELATEKVLGMWWCTSADCFTFKLTPNQQNREVIYGLKRPTKREVLRIMMTIFDPLGLIACVLMYIKILLQDIWRTKIEWDEVIKDEEYKRWATWVRVLPTVENVKVPRCYISTSWAAEIQLHLFVDASENGYTAVAYVRNVSNDTVETRLIGAKTRVAPLKSLSIPRLELQAALLGARLAKKIVDSHNIRFSHRFFWSDSKTVLCWLRSDHRRYRQFVAFRVSEILDLTTIEEWRWISTKKNVADEATKWKKPPDLSPTSRWFNGPKFLTLHPEHWPDEQVVGSTIEDLKTNFIGIHIQAAIYRSEEFSKWKTLLRSTAYVHRFIHNVSTKRTKLPKLSGYLTSAELQAAENYLLREAQDSAYAEEIADLKINRSVPKSSPILTLNPFLDENGILRANSRICLAANVGEDFKYPIILPRHHKTTLLIIHDFHLKYKHQNDETVVNVLRQKFYIAQIRAALKVMKKSCQQCKNKKARPNPPLMAPLPPARLGSFCRPFSYVGIDYFGPMTVSVGRRSEKRWGVLFTCLTIRAIHIELAHSLTADSCILCLRNFIARRGTPLEFHSDNGTNFHGAERELREAWTGMEKERMVEAFTTPTTLWKFIPPGSPHMGGCWERLVRSVKSVLYSSLPSRNPNDELLRGMLIEIENIINSRPLTYIPIHPENSEALTPNHFLLGSACGSKPAAKFNDDVIILRKNWLVSQQFAGRFWKRWVSEYLPTLTRRSKWSTPPAKPLEIGDIVLIVDPNNPRNSWPMGRIIKVKPSPDGQVRSATVQTSEGIYDRPAVKLALLDVRTGDSDVELPGGSVDANAPQDGVSTTDR